MRPLAALLLFAGIVFAQQPEIDNAKLETRAFAGSITQPTNGPYWIGYMEPILAGRHGDMCSWNRNNNDSSGRKSDAPMRLEGETALVVLVRMESGQVSELRVTSPDCRLDGGGLPFVWLTGVPAPESVAWLKSQTTTRHMDEAVMAISLHQDAAADRALNDLTAPSQPDNVRKKTAFWLGNSRGAQGVAMLKRMMASDPSPAVKEQVVFALSQSKDPGGMPAVIDAARTDKDPHVRSKALFWLAQRAAAKETTDAIRNAVNSDPESSVREQAVFALTQMPNGEGVPMLMDLAKNHRDPAVRKKAMFWLGQSKDPRALDFFAKILQP